MLQKLQQFLEANGAPYRAIRHRPAFTAQEVAAAEHVPGREFAKVVVLRAGDRYVMTVLPAPRRLDLEKVAALVPEHDAQISAEAEFAALFPDCEPGAMPPFGNLFGMSVIVDRALEKDDDIVFLVGSHAESARMKYADFKRLVQPQVADIGS